MGKKSKRAGTNTATLPEGAGKPHWSERLLALLERRDRLLCLALVLAATARIVATYAVFNHTIDEPAHVACGMQWLSKAVYRYEPHHPPLARVMAALGPYLAGAHSWGMKEMYAEGAGVLYAEFHYDRNLTLARLGVLPFFWIASAVVFLWSRRLFGSAVAVLATLLFTWLPSVLAHAGLATTDMALTGLLGAALMATLAWLKNPSLLRTVAFGALAGLMAISKLSALAYYPVCLLAMLIWKVFVERSVRPSLRLVKWQHVFTVVFAVILGALVIWAGYRFSYGWNPLTRSRLPAPAFFAGIKSIMNMNKEGWPSYLLGQRSNSGWWYYFFVALFFKTPIGFMALALWGMVISVERQKLGAYRIPAAIVGGILFFTMFSRVNIGTRHVLPVYIGFSMTAALCSWELLKKAPKARWAGWAVGVPLVWMLASSALSHPDYLPYFNAFAGDEPEKILVDSDLDWGQDMDRLGKRLKELGAREVTFSPFIIAYFREHHGFPPMRDMDPVQPSPGWNAVSLTGLKLTRLGLYEKYPEVTPWPELVRPTERVGQGTLLYYVPPAPVTQPPGR